MGTSRSQRILCVERTPDTSLILKRALPDFEVITACSVAHAKELLETDAFGFYVLDLVLPDGSGVEVREMIREVDPSQSIFFVPGSDPDLLIKDWPTKTKAAANGKRAN